MLQATFNRNQFLSGRRGVAVESASLIVSLVLPAVFAVGGLCLVLWMLSWNAG